MAFILNTSICKKVTFNPLTCMKVGKFPLAFNTVFNQVRHAIYEFLFVL